VALRLFPYRLDQLNSAQYFSVILQLLRFL
jgi:hypothetical protein